MALRDGIEHRWVALLRGDLAPGTVRAWAEDQLAMAPNVDEPTLRGLLDLRAVAVDEGADRGAAGDRWQRLGDWRRSLSDYDRDPEGWERGHFREVLRSFAGAHGEAATRKFGARLVGQGHLRSEDVDTAIREWESDE